MRRRWQIVAVIVVALALVWVATVAASDVRRPSRVYQLDSGHFVRTWLDEPIGLLCVALLGQDGLTPAGVSCVPLDQTAYGWAVGAPR